MTSEHQIGRLVLSSRNIYKVNKKSARQCLILSSTSDTILVNTNKDFCSRDNYVLVDTAKKQIIDNYGTVGNETDDLSIFHHLYTYFWISNSKLHPNFKKFNVEFDICEKREIYTNQVTTIDPHGSIDLDDGFSLNFSKDIIELDIHISDPTSYFDFTSEDTWVIFQEIISRVSTCYIPLNNKIKHLLPEINIGGTNLLEMSTLIGANKRAITFSFKINPATGEVDFAIRKTYLTDILNMTYETYDESINKNTELKHKLIVLCNFMTNHMKCSLNTSDMTMDTNISHKLIEIFMIWTNYFAGNYLHMNKNKMFVRTQDKFTEFEKEVPVYAKTFLNLGAKYEFILDKSATEYTHYSLGITNYCHVTSPMRRLVDMINHLIIHGIDNNTEYFDRLVKLIDVNHINSKLKNYKKISSAYDLITHLNINNTFRACIFKILSGGKALIVLYDELHNFKKLIKTDVPIEYYKKMKQFDEFEVELFYDSYKFKSKSLPFSIRIITE
jgi:exoribonuclease R